MDIVFFWDRNLNDGDAGIILSGKYFIAYDQKKNELTLTRNDRYVDSFWGRCVRSCFAIVGDNGAGKTQLVNQLLEDIRLFKDDPQSAGDLLIVGENGEKLAILGGGKCVNLCVRQAGPQVVPCELVCWGNHRTYLDEYEVAYFHNMLSRWDSLARSRCKYDFSLGRTIRRHKETSYEMHYHDLSRDMIQNYFDHEMFRVISFLYKSVINKNLEFPFPIPKWVSIQIADAYFNKSYMIERTKELRKNGMLSDVSDRDIEQFGRYMDRITQVFGETWINDTVKTLILNCYKEICLPEVTPGSAIAAPETFFEACAFLGEVSANGSDVYECTSRIIRNLRKKVIREKDWGYFDRVEKFITWLRRNEPKIRQMESPGIKRLYVPVCDETETWMNELIDLYLSMSFGFPFYEFSFGVSTGEYVFLTLFANLCSIVCRDTRDKYVYSLPGLDAKTKSILLIFDELDLAMHPRWQRMLIKWLTDFCEQIFQNVSVNIIVTTHSPILLSDFPAHSILYLEKDQTGKTVYTRKGTATFGCNVHTLYLDSFFLEEQGTMGAFAEGKINEIADRLIWDGESQIEYGKIEKMISYIGEGTIREQLAKRLNGPGRKLAAPVDAAERAAICSALSRLEEQRSSIDQLIRELEGIANDKN